MAPSVTSHVDDVHQIIIHCELYIAVALPHAYAQRGYTRSNCRVHLEVAIWQKLLEEECHIVWACGEGEWNPGNTIL